MAPADPDAPVRGRWLSRLGWLAAFLGPWLTFVHDLGAEPHFVDESAYISQAYYADLYLDGKHDALTWLEYAGVDLPPLPKYLIGWSLRLTGQARPIPADMRAWYDDPSFRSSRETPSALYAARFPSTLFGALGCVALYGLARMVSNPRAGLIAVALLTLNPLYRMHARRAMSDVIAEALILATVAVAIAGWRRIGRGSPLSGILLLTGLGGTFAGLAALAKLNGLLALMVILALGVASLFGPCPLIRRLTILTAANVAAMVALAVFIAGNPFLTAQPSGPLPPALAQAAQRSLPERLGDILRHRWDVSDVARTQFPHNALNTTTERIKAVVVQGFGRFGPFGPTRSDSTIRYDRKQDVGAVIWFPAALIGMGWAAGRGWRQQRSGEAPTAWAALLYAGLALTTVTLFIPLAWDRYYLSIQPPMTLLVACAFESLVVARFFRPRAVESAHAATA